MQNQWYLFSIKSPQIVKLTLERKLSTKLNSEIINWSDTELEKLERKQEYSSQMIKNESDLKKGYPFTRTFKAFLQTQILNRMGIK